MSSGGVIQRESNNKSVAYRRCQRCGNALRLPCRRRFSLSLSRNACTPATAAAIPPQSAMAASATIKMALTGSLWKSAAIVSTCIVSSARKRACGSKHHSRVTRIRASPCSASINVFVGPRGCKGGRQFRVRGKRRTDEVKHSHRVFRTLLECVRGATRNGYDLEQGLRRRPGWF